MNEDQRNCAGCLHFDSNACMNGFHWPEGVPTEPPCHEQKLFPPEFSSAMREYERTTKLHGEESSESRISFMLAMSLAPEWFMDEAGNIGREMGLLPPHPSSYSMEGEPLYSVGDIAKSLNKPIDEVQATVERFISERESIGLSNAGIITDSTLVHRVQ